MARVHGSNRVSDVELHPSFAVAKSDPPATTAAASLQLMFMDLL